jgi:heterodisulfide reductase subunit C
VNPGAGQGKGGEVIIDLPRKLWACTNCTVTAWRPVRSLNEHVPMIYRHAAVQESLMEADFLPSFS